MDQKFSKINEKNSKELILTPFFRENEQKKPKKMRKKRLKIFKNITDPPKNTPKTAKTTLKNVKKKGARGEREVVALLMPVVNQVYSECRLDAPKLQRNLQQYINGGADIAGIDWLAVEVKRQETLSLNRWWAQAVKQADDIRTPVVFYRQNKKNWSVLMERIEGDPESGYIDVSVSRFLQWFASTLKDKIG